jgi:hypothetical protein
VLVIFINAGGIMALITQEAIANALDWAYEKSVNGVAGLDSAIDLAESYKKAAVILP